MRNPVDRLGERAERFVQWIPAFAGMTVVLGARRLRSPSLYITKVMMWDPYQSLRVAPEKKTGPYV